MTDAEFPPPWQDNPRGLLRFVTGTRPDWDESEAWQAIHAAHTAGMPFDRLALRLTAIAFRHKPGEAPSSPLELRDEVRGTRPQVPPGSLDPHVKAALLANLAEATQAVMGRGATGEQKVLSEGNDNRQETS